MPKITSQAYPSEGIPLECQPGLMRLVKKLVKFDSACCIDQIGVDRNQANTTNVNTFFAPGSVVFIGFDGDIPIAYCSYFVDDRQGRVTIDGVYVEEAYRRHGIAKKFLNKILSLGYSFVDIGVMPNNEPAQKLYASLGFKPYITMMTHTQYVS